MNITVYCGANAGILPAYKEAAEALGNWIAKKGHTLVYGGGRIGLMGIISDRVLEEGGKVIGVIPHFLATEEQMHQNATEMIKVETISERKKRMLEQGDCYIALPGGTGTLEEIVEAISLRLLERHKNPCIFINVEGYYEPLKTMLDAMVENGFLPQQSRDKIHFIDSAEGVEKIIR
jgi:hypothetical protein